MKKNKKTSENSIEESVGVGQVDAGQVENESKPQAEKGSKPQVENASKPKRKWLIPLIILGIIIVALGVGAYVANDKYKQYLVEQQELAEQDAQIKEDALKLAEDTFHQHAVDDVSNGSGESIADILARIAKETMDGIKNRPPFVELTEENRYSFLEVESVLISKETGLVEVTVPSLKNELPKSDDGYFYLFTIPIYEDEISGEPVTKIEKDIDFTISCGLDYNSPSSKLFDKFCIAVLKDGQYKRISNKMYITNPEARAGLASSRNGEGSKKGLLVYSELIMSGQLQDLGVKHAAYNVYTSLICNGGGISYTYNGHTYNFNAYQVGLYDIIFSQLTNQGIDVNAIVINDLPNSTITYPGSRGGGATLYSFNPSDEEGVNMMGAVASFLANRYSGNSGHGKVVNWIIGNEVNERAIYNYTPGMGLQEYSELYGDCIRVFYNAFCAVNSTSRVYVSFDNRWNLDKGDSKYFDVKDMLDCFNNYIRSEGNINWHMGYHPYNYPLNVPKAWSWGGGFDKLAGNGSGTPIISMRNIHVLTDYLSQELYLDNNGQVRHVILSEMGYTSSHGQDLQAASICYAYKVMETNSHIDYMLLSRQLDAAPEVAEGMALGIVGKTSYQAYKALGTSEEANVCNKYLGTIGISSWSQIQNPR